MPNWTDNNITVTAKTEEGKEIVRALYKQIKDNEKVREGAGLLTYIAPIEGVDDENWYEYHVYNWGTKWDVPYSEICANLTDDGDKVEVTMSFLTAWVPCTLAIDTWDKKIGEDVAIHLFFEMDDVIGFVDYYTQERDDMGIALCHERWEDLRVQEFCKKCRNVDWEFLEDRMEYLDLPESVDEYDVQEVDSSADESVDESEESKESKE